VCVCVGGEGTRRGAGRKKYIRNKKENVVSRVRLVARSGTAG